MPTPAPRPTGAGGRLVAWFRGDRYMADAFDPKWRVDATVAKAVPAAPVEA